MRPPERGPAPQVRVHRALSSPVRARLLAVLRDEPGLDATALAQRLELHVNTVRSHLNVLEDAGLVEPVVEERERPGRPRLLYRVTEVTQAPLADDRGYRFLSAILASYLGATTDDAAAAAERAGTAWGGFVVDAPPPFTDLEPAAGVERLVAMLRDLGFAPEVDDDGSGSPRVLLLRCPFLDVARDHQEVVCSVHLGLMRGALDELGVDVQAEDLIPWAQPDACISHLRLGGQRT